MRNKTTIQFTGSKVTHMPHPFNEGTLCGKTGGSEQEGGHHEGYPEVTCKNCARTIPEGVWGKHTSHYVFLDGAHTSEMAERYSAKDLITNRDEFATWYPSKDGEINGILALWDDHFKLWVIAHN